MDINIIWISSLSIIVLIVLITLLASCLWCKKEIPKNELLGLEGMVKLKNPDDNLNGSNTALSVDMKSSSGNESESKRASNAPHRSLPDIPTAEPLPGDNNSELYATVGDKVQEKPQGRSPSSGTRKLASVSQHSSLSQADDVSSPYARVRSHPYDKLMRAEHPYAQVSQPGTSSKLATQNEIVKSESSESLLCSGVVGGVERGEGSTSEIAASAAIAGHISASQDLPYMTPPIAQLASQDLAYITPPLPQSQHFSGDSQDSSKGYTSISVREPLANIIAETKQRNAQNRRRDLNDSHYATVSDDSDEMYAAIEDPNHQGDLYTSGSETYAQIQPPPISVSVEINHQPTPPPAAVSITNETAAPSPTIAPSTTAAVVASTTSTAAQIAKRLSTNSAHLEDSVLTTNTTTTPVPPPLDSLRMHSRQESSSSCTSSVGNLGSPKPEKRQANSPLPPTPKVPPISIGIKNVSGDDKTDAALKKKQLSPSKDLEGMYAKVMKKNKLFNLPSENTSPVAMRKSTNSVNVTVEPLPSTINKRNSTNNNLEIFVSDPDVSKDISLTDFINTSSDQHSSPGKSSVKSVQNVVVCDNNYETIDKKRTRSNSYNRDPGYETIPGERNAARKRDSAEVKEEANRASGDYAQILSKGRASAPPGGIAQAIQKVSRNSLEIFHGMEKYVPTLIPAGTTIINEPGYESLPDRSLDPGYETLNSNRIGSRRDRNNSDYDPNYEELRPKESASNTTRTTDFDGYSNVWGPRAPNINADDSIRKSTKSTTLSIADSNDGYSSIKPVKQDVLSDPEPITKNKKVDTEPGYSEIKDPSIVPGNKSTATSPSNLSDTDHSLRIQTVPLPTPTTATNSTNISPASFSTLSLDSNSSETQIDYTSISSSSAKTITSSNQKQNKNYQSGSDTDPNYESVNYLNIQENPYERLHNEKNCSPDPTDTTVISTCEETTIVAINISNNNLSNSSTTTTVISQQNSVQLSTKNNDNIEVGDIYQV